MSVSGVAAGTSRRMGAGRGTRRGIRALGFLLLAISALLIAVWITPPVTFTALGQSLQVGAVPPPRASGLSGPGEAELFGGAPIDTVQRFVGPIRPRIIWTRFDTDAAASAFFGTTHGTDKGPGFGLASQEVGEAIARAWMALVVRMGVIAGILGALGYVAWASARDRLRRARWRRRGAPADRSGGEGAGLGHPDPAEAQLLSPPVVTSRGRPALAGAVLASLVTLTAAGLTVFSAREQLAGISTLADITGTAPLVAAPPAVGPPRNGMEVAVVGDSTAAGVGNAPLADPTDADVACARSQDAYAQVLASATGWSVVNLACSSATIPVGLLGAQPRRPVTPPPQVGVLKSMVSLRAVIVSIGANDVGWGDFVKYCYGLSRCDDRAAEQHLRSRLDMFRLHYLQLLQQLRDLPTRPAVIITGYYDPFGDSFDCAALRDPRAPATPPAGYGFAPDPGHADQTVKVVQKVEPLRSLLSQLNTVLTQGADAFGFATVIPSFRGHELCSQQPWVQGMSDEYPFHPRASGELAIAAAVLPRLLDLHPAP